MTLPNNSPIRRPATSSRGLPDWYESASLQPNWIGRLLPRFLLTPIRDPKIIRVLESRPAYRRASVGGWESTLLRPRSLPAATREAIAVAVSIANQCVY